MDFAGHFVAVIGSGVAGAEAAAQLAAQGIYVVLIEQNKLPYGKIETGLPKWHINLRNQEEKKIDKKINQEEILFIPDTGLGKDVELNDLHQLGFSAIILATGASQDRPLPVKNIDNYIGKGLYYQNPFVEWFNRKHETNYSKFKFSIPPKTIIVGGGLASLDVAKIVMLESVSNAFDNLGIEVDMFDLEKKGIPYYLNEFNTSLKELGVKPCTLYYRKQIKNMPLAPLNPNLNSEKKLKVYQLRERILKNFQSQYLFDVVENMIPIDFITKGDKLTGLIFARTESLFDEMKIDHNSQKRVNCNMAISSIGSIPAPVPGLTNDGPDFEIIDKETGRIADTRNIFAIGNAVTGRGNIRESMLDGRYATQNIMVEHLSWDEEIEALILSQINSTKHQVKSIADSVKIFPPLSGKTMETIFEWATSLQVKAGYNGDYELWIGSHKPQRLEE